VLNTVKYKSAIDKLLLIIISVCIVLYPLTSFIVEGGRSVYIVILILLSIVAFTVRWSEVKKIELSRIEKWFLTSYFLMFIIALASIVFMGEGVDGNKRLAAYSGFLFSIPIYYLFRLYMPPSRIIWAAIVIACYIVATRAWLEVNGIVEDIEWSSFPVSRANGAMHPIRFGNLTLLLGFIALAGSLYIKDVKLWMKLAGILAFFCGLYASVLSQSRGGWIAIPLLLVIVLWPVFRELTVKSKVALLVAIVISMVVVFNLTNLKVSERFKQAESDIVQYQKYNNSSTSLGARFDMYETAYNIFLQKPWFGVGIGNYRKHSASYYELNEDRLSTDVIMWGNPHNEILMHMATRGVVGLVVLVMLFVVGIYLFYSNMRKYNQNTLFFAVSGLLIFVAYLHYGMSVALFLHRDMTVFFIMYVTLFVAGIYKECNTSTEA